MKESQRESAFPVHIDLGTKFSNGPEIAPAKPDERTHYPTLYISGVKVLDKIPSKGCMLIDYEVVGFHKSKDGPGSIEIECRTICAKNDEDEEESDEHGDTNDMIDDMARKAGLLKDEDEEE